MEEMLVSGWSDDPDGERYDVPLDVRPDARLEFAIARAEVAARSVNAATAAQFEGIAAALREAREFPELYLPPRDGSQLSSRERAERSEFAVRSAVADLAVRLRVPEVTIRSRGLCAEMLQRRTPLLWTLFRDGDIPVGNANTTADLAATLPASVCAAFEAAVLNPAQHLSTPRFRDRARRVRERLDPQPLTVRHQVAREQRRVWFEPDRDGMCWLGAYLPADIGRVAMNRLDAAAASLATADGETRTLAQLRADIAGDLLTGSCAGTGDGTGHRVPTVTVSVAVTVPVLTLLGVEELPGTLEGYGPIDPDTARRLSGRARSFQRILTHPITGTVLDIDRSSYRVPADLKRWTELRDQHCTFPGCGRSARHCDLDHPTAWQHNGTTNAANLAHLCRHHHRLKHESNWKITPAADGSTTWTTPTGEVHTTDPPPF